MLLNSGPRADRQIAIASPYFPPEEQEWLKGELVEILNGQLSMGRRVRRFEEAFAAYCGAAQGIAFPTCTAALEVVLQTLGVSSGDEVLVPVETFIATGMAVYLVGARPVFTEISPKTFAMDFDDAWSRVSARTRGAIVVHFGGFIDPGLPAFVERMHGSGRFVIEDAAHAHGAELGGSRAGSIGDAGCFSFYPTKIMTTGEGGMLVTSRDELAQTARSLQNRGLDLTCSEEQYILPGRNNRFTEIAAAMGISQLRCLPDFLSRRRRIASVYDACLEKSDLFRPVMPGGDCRPSYWRYVALPQVPVDRVALKEALAADGAAIDWAYAPPLHLQPFFQRSMGTRPGMLPRSEEILSRHVCLPVHARMEEDAEYVAERLLHHTRLLLDGRTS